VTPSSPGEVSRLLQQWHEGDAAAYEKLIPLVYGELRRIAGRHMAREQPGRTLQPTALANEAYIRLVGAGTVGFQNRVHFCAVASHVMRRILVESARRRGSRKRGGSVCFVSIHDAGGLPQTADSQLVALDDALKALMELDPRKAKVVELRHFGGLSLEEAAEVLHVSPETVKRDWKLAKIWLLRELSRSARDLPPKARLDD
jgi:RNA polymerase sigma factor (TIGR02999 family)